MRRVARARGFAPFALAALFSFAPPGLLPAARADLVYVLNSADASITLLDAASRQEVRRIPVLREVHHLLLTPDGTSLLVGDSGGNELLYLDPNTAEIQRRERFSNPYHMDFTPDGKVLVVTSLRRDQVDIYDLGENNNLTLRHRVSVGDKPSHLAFSPDSRIAYVTLQGANTVTAIDIATGVPNWTVEVGTAPAGILWHNDRLLVGIMGADHVAVLMPQDGRIERTIQTARGAHTVFASPDRRALYATSRVDSRITVLDPDTLDVRARWDIPGGPDCIAFDPQGRLWATLRWVARVAIIQPDSGEFELVRVGRSPHGVLVQPGANLAPMVMADGTATPVIAAPALETRRAGRAAGQPVASQPPEGGVQPVRASGQRNWWRLYGK